MGYHEQGGGQAAKVKRGTEKGLKRLRGRVFRLAVPTATKKVRELEGMNFRKRKREHLQTSEKERELNQRKIISILHNRVGKTIN